MSGNQPPDLDPRCNDSVRIYSQHIRCEYAAGHAGPHRAVVEWAGTSPVVVRQQ